MEPQFYSLVEAAKLLGVTSDAIRARIERKQIPVVRFGERRILIAEETLNQLLKGTLRTPDGKRVSVGGQRFTVAELTCAFVRIGKKAGITRISTSPHRLRHTANVLARQAGVDALTRARMLGHRSLRTLARYDHLVPGRDRCGSRRAASSDGRVLAVAKPTDGEEKAS